MAVDGLAVAFGGRDFTHQLRVFVNDARVVHHLREVIDFGKSHQFLNVIGIEGGTRRLKSRGRYTTRRTKEELERHFLSIFDHIADAFLA